MIMPFNNIVLAELLETKKDSGILLPERNIGRFVRLKILGTGKLVEDIKPGDIVIANAVLEIIDPKQPNVGFINSRDILGKEVNK